MSNEPSRQVAQEQMWSSAEQAELWQKEAKRRQKDMAEATQRMLEAAELKPGYRVLDIAAGTGDQSILAARIVGSGGSVVATDLSAAMLNIAAQCVQQEGLTNITTRVMDAQQLALEDNAFDAVICRNGLMFVPHLQQALSEIRRVLKPGGKLTALVWSVPEHNPLFSLLFAIMAKHLREASFGPTGLYSLSNPAVFEQALKEAGFSEIVTQPIPLSLHYVSLDDFLQSSGRRTLSGAAGKLSQQDQQHLMEEIKQALSRFEDAQGFVAPGETLLGVGTK